MKINLILLIIFLISCKNGGGNSIPQEQVALKTSTPSSSPNIAEDFDGDGLVGKMDRDEFEAQIPIPEFKVKQILRSDALVLTPPRIWTSTMYRREIFLQLYFDSLKKDLFRTNYLNFWFIYEMNMLDSFSFNYLSSISQYKTKPSNLIPQIKYELSWETDRLSFNQVKWNITAIELQSISEEFQLDRKNFKTDLIQAQYDTGKDLEEFKKSIMEKNYLLVFSSKEKTTAHYIHPSITPADFLKKKYPFINEYQITDDPSRTGNIHQWALFNTDKNKLYRERKTGEIIAIMEIPTLLEQKSIQKRWAKKSFTLTRYDGLENEINIQAENVPTILVFKIKNKSSIISAMPDPKENIFDPVLNFDCIFLKKNLKNISLREFLNNGEILTLDSNFQNQFFYIHFFENFPTTLNLGYAKHPYLEYGLGDAMTEVASTIEIDLYQWQ